MNKLFSGILLATGASVFIPAADALADNNTAFLNQSGIGNSALLDQTAAGNSNIGVSGLLPAAQQSGNDNILVITQSGGANRISSNAAAAQLRQTGDSNSATVTQTRVSPSTSPSTSTGNIVTVLTQDGDGNSTSIVQNTDQNRNYANVRQTNSGGDTDGNMATVTQSNTATDNQNPNRNEVSSGPGHTGGVEQNGMRNSATAMQDGQGLRLRLLKQTGDDNTASVSLSGIDNGQPDLTAGGASGASGATGAEVMQTGNRNQTGLDISGERNAYGVSQQGDDNLALDIMVTGSDNSVGAGQFGDRNEIDLSSITGNNNSVGFYQFGSDNFASAVVNENNNRALISQVGSSNETFLNVIGDNNIATLGMIGDSNYANGLQSGDFNVMTLDFEGNGNNASAFSSGLTGGARDARDFVRGSTPGAISFSRGDLFQQGEGNTMTITGTLADNNSFAMFQGGDNNLIVGRIENGSFNQAVVAQVGNGNIANFSQTGSHNNLGIMQ